MRTGGTGGPFINELRVLVAAGSEFMWTAYNKILETQAHLRVAVTAWDREEGVKQDEVAEPGAAASDSKLPNLGGLESARRTVARRPRRDGSRCAFPGTAATG